MAERHMEEYTKKSFPEPKTLFDDYAGRPAAAEAEMNILEHMGWAGDNKLFPETMDELGLAEIGPDKGRFKGEMARFTPSQRETFLKYYTQINEEFKQRYPSMSQEDIMKWKYQRYMQDYLGTIKAVDENVGRLLDYLEANDLMENTIIVYTSDQGFYLGEHGWYDKRFVYDESFKTPLLMAWPGRSQGGATSDALVQNLDFAQTFLDAAGVKAPKDMQGESMLPLLNGNEKKWTRDEVYYHYYEYPAEHMVQRHYALITQEYKLVHFYFPDDRWELIDRKKDQLELHNYYDDPAYAQIRKELHRELDKIRKKYKDSDEVSQGYIDRLIQDAENDKVYGAPKAKVDAVIQRSRENKK